MKKFSPVNSLVGLVVFVASGNEIPYMEHMSNEKNTERLVGWVIWVPGIYRGWNTIQLYRAL